MDVIMLDSSESSNSRGSRGEDLLEDDEEEEIKRTLNSVMDELVDDVVLGLCFETHRSCKLGTLFLDETDIESENLYRIVDQVGLDVFGQLPQKKQLECICPNCSRNLAASRFAPHLEKCMGMGRNSSRIASRRILANTGKQENVASDNDSEDNKDDNDWSYAVDRKSKKSRKDRSGNSPRRGKISKLKNGDGAIGQHDTKMGSSHTTEASGQIFHLYDSMTLDEKKSILIQQCGVISEHTKKMCTRSHRCPQHSDEQRRMVRMYLLGSQHGGLLDVDEVQVDIDGYEDGDSQSLRESLQWEAASNPSPADSTSTTHSTGSRKRKKGKGGKKKGAIARSSPSSMYEFNIH
ncbi:unnamed protein product [Owenia fusiformis]|uniref:SAGA-associated factor 11 homolog n=1 Tax=Owenia fusiformis TaxID=6347 RepID=A0A8S4N193_OWEFU|nr:unnamed protein product [Owenia fusiformis]